MVLADVVVSVAPADESPVEIVSTEPFIVVFTKSISRIWFRTGIISSESGITVRRIMSDAAASTSPMLVILILLISFAKLFLCAYRYYF